MTPPTWRLPLMAHRHLVDVKVDAGGDRKFQIHQVQGSSAQPGIKRAFLNYLGLWLTFKLKSAEVIIILAVLYFSSGIVRLVFCARWLARWTNGLRSPRNANTCRKMTSKWSFAARNMSTLKIKYSCYNSLQIYAQYRLTKSISQWRIRRIFFASDIYL